MYRPQVLAEKLAHLRKSARPYARMELGKARKRQQVSKAETWERELARLKSLEDEWVNELARLESHTKGAK